MAVTWAYGSAVVDDPDLAAAIEGRPYWAPVGVRAVRYAPPGAELTVLVQPVRMPRHRERYTVSVQRNGVAVHARPAHSAAEAIAYAERARLD